MRRKVRKDTSGEQKGKLNLGAVTRETVQQAQMLERNDIDKSSGTANEGKESVAEGSANSTGENLVSFRYFHNA